MDIMVQGSAWDQWLAFALMTFCIALQLWIPNNNIIDIPRCVVIYIYIFEIFGSFDLKHLEQERRRHKRSEVKSPVARLKSLPEKKMIAEMLKNNW